MTRKKIRDGLMLFAYFVRIGCFTFGGGWGILAQMEQEFIDRQHRITREDLLDLVAVSKSLPGIMITNVATLFGYQMAGAFGAVCAVCGIALPAVVILSVVTACYTMLRDNLWFAAAMKGINACVVPIIGTAALSLGREVFTRKSGRLLCLLGLALLLFTPITNIELVFVGVVCTIVWIGREHDGIS